MKAAKIFLSGLAGTSLMTVFSYAVSESKEKNFKEPEQLSKLLERLSPEIKKELAEPAGWAGHYAMGIAMASFQSFLFQKGGVKPDLKNALLIGAFSGAAGILIWKLVFKMHPNPPKMDMNRYFGHLLLAHLVFTLAVTMMNRSRMHG